MANQPFYHLRPNKSIDRSLFLQTLIGLSRQLPISEYHYTGFGSYLFDDFKLLHDTLGISNLVSLERDDLEFERAKFNLPYSCIDIKKISSTEYLSNLILDDSEHNIFWLDFVTPAELGVQLADYVTLLDLLNPNDIIRITLNANPDSLGKTAEPDKTQQYRLDTLYSRVPSQYIPHTVNKNDVTRKNYPLTLLKILKAASMQALEDNPPHSPNFLFPIFSSVYADGQQMLTFMGIVLDSHEREQAICDSLFDYPHCTFAWDQPTTIEIPTLSVREITEINKLLPGPNAKQQLEERFPFIFSKKNQQAVESYINYYKYYPHYHQVSF